MALKPAARVGPATLAEVMREVESSYADGSSASMRPVATGFCPLDEILNGGVRAGELLVIGGPFGVGKTIWGLQVARNAVFNDPALHAMYICYEHDRSHLLARLLCLESAELGLREDALTLRRLTDMEVSNEGQGMMSRLRRMPRYARILESLEVYADRLILVKASGDHSTLQAVRGWVHEAGQERGRLLVVVDYLQKIPLDRSTLEVETETTTYLTQGLKEMAMAEEVPVITIAASDREGLKSRRMRLQDLRGSSALQYEADVGLILNNKFAIVSREHMIYNTAQAEGMRNWVVMSVEKNRAGRSAVDMEYLLDAAHFRIVPTGDFVRERLVDERVIME